MAFIQRGEISMAHMVGIVAARVVSQVGGAGGPLGVDDLIDAVYAKLDEASGRKRVEAGTDRRRVERAIKLAISFEKGEV